MEPDADESNDTADEGKASEDDDVAKQLRAQQEQQEVVRQLQRTLVHLETGREGVYNPLPLVKACSALRLDYPVRNGIGGVLLKRMCVCV